MSYSSAFAGALASHWMLVITGVIVLRTVAIIIYRLAFHPLAKYPGPLLARITDGYAAYHAFKGDLHLDMARCHEQYGDIVRYGPNKALFNNAEGLHDIFHSSHVKKSKGYLPILPAPGAFSVHTSIDKAMHRHKRKVVSQGLSDSALRKFEPSMIEHIDLFIGKICQGSDDDYTGWSPAKNMTDLCNYLTFDVMGEFGFGRAFNMQNVPDNRFLIDAISASNLRTSIYAQFPELAKLKLEKILYPQGYKMRQKFLALTKDFSESRTTVDKHAKNDLFSFIVDAKDPETGEGFSARELWSESKFLIVAGSDTSSTALASAMFYLSCYPESYDKLANEVRRTFSDSSEIRSGAQMSSCKYLRAVIDETMRISPPAGGAMWRESEDGGVFIGGEHIPAGLDVGTSMYAIHHNEKYYPDPYTFKPERWLETEGATRESVAKVRAAYNPFSLGTRGCIGRSFAYMEIMDTLAKIMWHTDFRRSKGPLGMVGAGIPGAKKGRHRVKEFQLVDHLTSQKDGPFLEFRPRTV